MKKILFLLLMSVNCALLSAQTPDTAFVQAAADLYQPKANKAGVPISATAPLPLFRKADNKMQFIKSDLQSQVNQKAAQADLTTETVNRTNAEAAINAAKNDKMSLKQLGSTIATNPTALEVSADVIGDIITVVNGQNVRYNVVTNRFSRAADTVGQFAKTRAGLMNTANALTTFKTIDSYSNDTSIVYPEFRNNINYVRGLIKTDSFDINGDGLKESKIGLHYDNWQTGTNMVGASANYGNHQYSVFGLSDNGRFQAIGILDSNSEVNTNFYEMYLDPRFGGLFGINTENGGLNFNDNEFNISSYAGGININAMDIKSAGGHVSKNFLALSDSSLTTKSQVEEAINSNTISYDLNGDGIKDTKYGRFYDTYDGNYLIGTTYRLPDKQYGFSAISPNGGYPAYSTYLFKDSTNTSINNYNSYAQYTGFRMSVADGDYEVTALDFNRGAASLIYDRRGLILATDGNSFTTSVELNSTAKKVILNSENEIELKNSTAITGRVKAQNLRLSSIPVYASDSAAATGGAVQGDVYRNSAGALFIKL